MVRAAKQKALPIGLDLGTGTVRMAQLELFSEQRVVLLAARSAAVPPEIRSNQKDRLGFFSKTVREMLKSGDFHGQQCVMSLPAEAVCVQHVRIAKVSPEETEDAVKQELEGKVPFALDTAEVRYVVAGEVVGDEEKKQEVIAVATPRETLDAYLDMARHARLDVVGVNVACCATVECFARLFRRDEDAGRTVLFVDAGATSTQVVLSKGSRLTFARNLAMGGEQLDQAIAEKMGVSVEQAGQLRLGEQPEGASPQDLHEYMREPLQSIADELTQCLRYYESVFRNQSVERAIFVGGQAYDKAMCQALAKRLNLPAQIGDPLLRIERSPAADAALSQQQPQPDWTVAVGLSFGAAEAA
ncbi:MAG: pilus assembly protein PilM [Phycisphaerae bacterium]